ncbi:hypothetical protein FOG48_02726 [Hanseniaspora uvarum]|nr:hypothetical protein FOG48_02726 [Hanseniaspora uvarum]
MSAVISQPFRIDTLPKIAQLNNPLNQYALLPTSHNDSNNKTSDYINIGISGSSISQYIINPSPKLIFNYSISSIVNITNLDTFVYKNTKEEDEDIELWVYSTNLSNNKNNLLNFFIRSKNLMNESNSNIISKSTLSLDDDVVVDLRIINKNHILVVLHTGKVRLYKIYPHRKVEDKEEVLFKLINEYDSKYDNMNYTQIYQKNNKYYIFALLKISNNDTDIAGCLKLLEVSAENKIIENQSVIIDNINLNNSKYQQFFNHFTNEYVQLDLQNKSLKISVLSNDLILKLSEQIDLSSFITADTNLKTISIQSIAKNRIILNTDNEVYLLDLVHKSLLSSRTISNNSIKTFQLLKNWYVENDEFFNDNNTLILGVSTKPSSKVSYLELMNVNVGEGNLKESLGKSFLISNEENKKDKKWGLIYKNVNNANAELNLDEIFNQLSELIKNTDSTKFDNAFFKLLKLDSNKGYYDENSDRFLNSQHFITEMNTLLLNNYINKEIVNESFIYLLTHPLYQYTENLLSKLQFDFRLYKQCILTCPFIPIEDLMSDLFQINNIELLFNLTCRIFNDYNKAEIKQSIKKLNKFNVKNFIEFIINYSNYNIEKFNIKESMPKMIEFLNLIIDSIGYFQLDLITLKKMNKFIVKNIKIIKSNNEILNLVIENKTYGNNGGINYNLTKKKNQKSIKEKNMKLSVEYIEI